MIRVISSHVPSARVASSRSSRTCQLVDPLPPPDHDLDFLLVAGSGCDRAGDHLADPSAAGDGGLHARNEIVDFDHGSPFLPPEVNGSDAAGGLPHRGVSERRNSPSSGARHLTRSPPGPRVTWDHKCAARSPPGMTATRSRFQPSTVLDNLIDSNPGGRLAPAGAGEIVTRHPTRNRENRRERAPSRVPCAPQRMSPAARNRLRGTWIRTVKPWIHGA